MPRINTSDSFEAQSFRYVKENIDKDRDVLEWPWQDSPPKVESVLDVGCGSGHALGQLKDLLGATRAVGIEPSPDAVELLKNKHRGSGLEFVTGTVAQLPFADDEFEFVNVWSVLHWVPRNHYLQALGELVRVTGKFLQVMDFGPSVDFAVPYAWDTSFFTYHVDYVPPIVGSGVMKVMQSSRHWHDKEHDIVRAIDASELGDFLGNSMQYVARKVTLFGKNERLLPIHVESDFQ